MTHAVIGAKGEMGKYLLLPLLQQFGPVVAVDRQSGKKEWESAWKADVIWLSIPRDEIPRLLRGVSLRPEQLVIDICSIKRRLSEEISKTGAAHLSLHPLHGPHIPLSGQKWVVVSIPNKLRNRNAEEVIELLKSKDINILTANSEDEHDFMIGVVLSIPEVSTIIMDSLIEEYAKESKQENPDIKKIMEWAVPASNALFSAHIHSINSSANWLRKDLIVGAHSSLLQTAKEALGKLSRISAEEIDNKIIKQRKFVENLPIAERKRIRSWLENWFVDANQTIFSFHQNKQPKPKITIQEKKKNSEVFPTNSKKLTVGIHGIAGCFTEESVIRLCQEIGVDADKIEFEYLTEAENVIKAVLDGRVKRGAVAVANSGSGVYESSMHALGRSEVEIQAIYGMEILQCLIVHKDITNVGQIAEVFGHPQAVSQCKRTFTQNYPKIRLREGQDSDDTALCVKKIAQGELPKTTATLASQIAAERYGLKVLEYGMHHDPFNTTTFIVVKRKDL